MFIKMDKTKRGADDHDLNTVNTYVEGKTYKMGEILAGVFIREKWGHVVKAPKAPKKGADKKDDGDPDENKEEKTPPENKKGGKE